jgi:protein-S-isoprenylcysteine O-methyltransferase Ste14
LVLEIVIRAPFQKTWKTGVKTDRRESRTEKIMLGSMTVVMLVFPLVYSLTDWLDFANYNLPIWMGWLSMFVLACALLVFWRGHIDLKSNWSPTLEIRQDHTLVTNGIYRYIRHLLV